MRGVRLSGPPKFLFSKGSARSENRGELLPEYGRADLFLRVPERTVVIILWKGPQGCTFLRGTDKGNAAYAKENDSIAKKHEPGCRTQRRKEGCVPVRLCLTPLAVGGHLRRQGTSKPASAAPSTAPPSSSATALIYLTEYTPGAQPSSLAPLLRRQIRERKEANRRKCSSASSPISSVPTPTKTTTRAVITRRAKGGKGGLIRARGARR